MPQVRRANHRITLGDPYRLSQHLSGHRRRAATPTLNLRPGRKVYPHIARLESKAPTGLRSTGVSSESLPSQAVVPITLRCLSKLLLPARRAFVDARRWSHFGPAASWSGFFRDLVARGLFGVGLLTSDAHPTSPWVSPKPARQNTGLRWRPKTPVSQLN